MFDTIPSELIDLPILLQLDNQSLANFARTCTAAAEIAESTFLHKCLHELGTDKDIPLPRIEGSNYRHAWRYTYFRLKPISDIAASVEDEAGFTQCLSAIYREYNLTTLKPKIASNMPTFADYYVNLRERFDLGFLMSFLLKNEGKFLNFITNNSCRISGEFISANKEDMFLELFQATLEKANGQERWQARSNYGYSLLGLNHYAEAAEQYRVAIEKERRNTYLSSIKLPKMTLKARSFLTLSSR